MSLDTQVRKVAQRALHAIGTSVTYQRVTPGAYNVSTGSVPQDVSEVTLVGRLDDYTDRQLSNTIRAGDRSFTFAAADVTWEPDVDDTVLLGDVTYTIVRVHRYMVQHLPGTYVLQLRA